MDEASCRTKISLGEKKKEKAVSICNKLQGVTKRILNGEAIKGNEEKRMENRRKDFHTSL